MGKTQSTPDDTDEYTDKNFKRTAVDVLMKEKYGKNWTDLEETILVAYRTNRESLTLRVTEAPIIPSCIGLCTNLKELKILGKQLTVPREIGKLTELTHLQTYCCRMLFYPYELSYCSKLGGVGGSNLYIDLSSLLGRYSFPPLNNTETLKTVTSLTEACARVVVKEKLDTSSLPQTLQDKLKTNGPKKCSICFKALNDFDKGKLVWHQHHFGGDGRGMLPLLTRVCSPACAAHVEKATPNDMDVLKSRMYFTPKSGKEMVIGALGRGGSGRGKNYEHFEDVVYNM
mmetsp:Transcript_18974/g.21138  ORF Transcript_18974/g.21138 Transcript_18974/m.21138 type:complete len:286 (+) Transcript_18974:22-879(+)